MPELPEVETMRRGLLPLVGRCIQQVDKLPCPRKPIAIQPRIDHLRRRLMGQTIDEVSRLGKRVAVQVSSGDRLIIEPRMTGLVLLADPPDPLYLRLRIGFAETSGRGEGPLAFYYWDRRGLGSVRLLDAAQCAAEFGPARLGPDALEVTVADLQQRLSRSKRAIKVALLDQTVVAGIGNLYAAEILFVTGIHPEQRCERLTVAQWQAVVDATHEVLEEAIHYEGSTLGDGTYRNALNQQGSYQNHHRVYGKAGEPCPRCGRAIERIVQSQRSTFFCPNCQTKRQPRRQSKK